MTAFVLLARTASGAPLDAGDHEAVARAADALCLGAPTQSVAGLVAGLAPAGLLAAPGRIARAFDAPPIHVAPLDGRVLVASSGRALLSTGLVPRSIDPSGIAGLLWRGAPVAHRPPLAGTRGVPAGAALAWDPDHGWRLEAAAPAHELSTPAEVRLRVLESLPARGGGRVVSSAGGPGGLALAGILADLGGPAPELITVRFPADAESRLRIVGRLVEAQGARHHVIDPARTDPVASLSTYVSTCDVPTPDGFAASLVAEALAAAGISDALDAAGASILFGAGPAFAAVAREPRARGLRRKPPSADALDVDAQREVELRAFARVPVNLALSAAARLPAGTREALSRCGPRPVDGFRPAPGSRLEVAVETWLRGTFADRVLGAPRPARPVFLEPRVLAAIRGLPPPVRFGRPGSGGLLARLAGRGATRARAHSVGLEATLAAWTREALRPWLEAILAPDRVAATRVLEPGAVAEALRRARAGAGGWTATRILTLAFLVAWIERERLALPPGTRDAGRPAP